MTTQNDKAAAWLRQHGIAAPCSEPAGAAPSGEDALIEDDWASDAERWYEQRAQGVDVAQLLRYQRHNGPK